MLTNRDDYLEGRQFLSRHEDSDIIRSARSIVGSKFNEDEQAEWRRVLESSDFCPDHNKREKEASRRFVRWFDVERR